MVQDIIAELKWRGLIHQTTDDEGIAQWLLKEPRQVYNGFDPTADSLHIGHFVPIMNLRRFQKAGHRPLALVGGATGMIGDPSGKSEERNLLTPEAIEKNVAGIREQMGKFLDFDGPNGAKLVNNYDWMGEYKFLEFLRDVGKHFPVNVMLSKDSVKQRLERSEAGLTFTEFSYMLLQSYDFVYLYRNFGCEMQTGGSDQWGNITAGVDLARRMDGVHLRGLTYPLLLKSDGKKMGKTESGTLWLDPERTSPYHFYQYWINLEDADAGTALRFFGEMGETEYKELISEHEKSPEKRNAQRRLAEDLTRLVHGEDGLSIAERATKIFFGGEISGLNDAQLGSIFADVPGAEMPQSVLSEGVPVIDALVATKLAASKSDARRTIQQGGAYVNNRPKNDLDAKLTTEDLASETIIVLRSGKKRYALLKFTK